MFQLQKGKFDIISIKFISKLKPYISVHSRSKDHENLEFDQNQKLHISIPLNLSKNKNAGDFRSARVKMASNTWYKLVEDDYNYKENHHSFRKHKRVFETYSSKKMNRSQKIIHNINPNEQQYYEKYNFDITPTNLRKEILEFVEQPKIIVVKSGIIVNNDTNFNGNYMISQPYLSKFSLSKYSNVKILVINIFFSKIFILIY